MTTPVDSVTCPCCEGIGYTDEWYETDDEGNWHQFTDVCNLCIGWGFISGERAVILRLQGRLYWQQH